MRVRNRITDLGVFSLLLTIGGCLCQKEVEKFTAEKPLAVEVTKARSYFHAKNIQERLQETGLGAYLVASTDSTEGGKWYKVLVGAHVDTSAIQAFSESLRVSHGFESLTVIDYRDIGETLAEVVIDSIEQEERIDAHRPGVPQRIYDVISKFPRTNMFYVKQMYVFNTYEDDDDKSKFQGGRDIKLDLPRGIGVGRLLGLSQAFAEAIYQDNLYDDKVTFDIIKLKSDHGLAQPPVTKASFWPVESGSFAQLAIAGFFADLILNTGEYATEEKTEISVASFRNLTGYKTVIEPRAGYFRTYLILVDEASEYVIFCQSTDKTQKELYKVLELVGMSQGLLEYEEFYNTFFTLPSQFDSTDTFVGFYIDKLDWRYAKSKGNANWAKACVGHWAAHGLFYAEDEGPWTYGIFDFLTEGKVEYVNSLYSAHEYEGRKSIPVYGASGFLVSKWRWSRSRSEYYWHPKEVNFPIKRYVCMVDNVGATRLNKDELVEKAHGFQFHRGGYQQVAQTEEQLTTKF